MFIERLNTNLLMSLQVSMAGTASTVHGSQYGAQGTVGVDGT
jgi:hypothetical protein